MFNINKSESHQFSTCISYPKAFTNVFCKGGKLQWALQEDTEPSGALTHYSSPS